MKRGICFSTLPGALSVAERMQLAREAGFDGVEIRTMESVEEAEQLKAAADAAGIAIPSIMGSQQWQYPLSSNDADVRRQSLDNVLQSIETAKIVGADTVLIVPGIVNPDTTYEEAYLNSQQALREVVPAAEESGVALAIENVWNKMLLSPIEFRRYIEEFHSPAVGAYFDVGNILIYGYPEQWIGSLRGLIKKVHVKDFIVNTKAFTYLFQGDVNWPKVTAALQSVGYDDYVTAELPPYPTCPDEFVKDIARRLGRIIEGRY